MSVKTAMSMTQDKTRPARNYSIGETMQLEVVGVRRNYRPPGINPVAETSRFQLPNPVLV